MNKKSVRVELLKKLREYYVSKNRNKKNYSKNV